MRFSKLFLISLGSIATLVACSLYQSDGHEAIEKNKIDGLTSSGVSFNPKTRYECSFHMAVPTEWQSPAQSLNEFVTVEGVQAILLTETEAPKVIVYRWTDRHAEACQLTVLDAKLSSQNLSDIVIFGESLLARR